MELIPPVVRDFEITKSVVVFDAVEVINHHPIRDGASKSLINKAMDFEGFDPFCSLSEAENIVPVFISTSSNDLSGSTPNASHVRDAVTGPAGNFRPNLVSDFIFHTDRLPADSW